MRVKRGTVKKQKHKKVLQSTKGYRLSYSKLYRRALEARLHAGKYSFAHRKKRAGQFRRIWIKRINAALSTQDMKYSQFINGMKVKNIELNRKVLANLALDNPTVFVEVVNTVK